LEDQTRFISRSPIIAFHLTASINKSIKLRSLVQQKKQQLKKPKINIKTQLSFQQKIKKTKIQIHQQWTKQIKGSPKFKRLVWKIEKENINGCGVRP